MQDNQNTSVTNTELSDFLTLRDKVIEDWPSFLQSLSKGNFSREGGGLPFFLYEMADANPKGLESAFRLAREGMTLEPNISGPEDIMYNGLQKMFLECAVLSEKHHNLPLKEEAEKRVKECAFQGILRDIYKPLKNHQFDAARQVVLNAQKEVDDEISQETLEKILRDIDTDIALNKRSRHRASIATMMIVLIVGSVGLTSTSFLITDKPQIDKTETKQPPIGTQNLTLPMLRWCYGQYHLLSALKPMIASEEGAIQNQYINKAKDQIARCGGKTSANDEQKIKNEIANHDYHFDAQVILQQWRQNKN